MPNVGVLSGWEYVIYVLSPVTDTLYTSALVSLAIACLLALVVCKL